MATCEMIAITTKRRYRIRLNHSNDKAAETSPSAAATRASNAEISVSFFSTVSRELSVS